MKIEILYPEMSNIYGDYGNIMFLKKCLPEAEFIETSLHTEPEREPYQIPWEDD